MALMAESCEQASQQYINPTHISLDIGCCNALFFLAISSTTLMGSGNSRDHLKSVGNNLILSHYNLELVPFRTKQVNSLLPGGSSIDKKLGKVIFSVPGCRRSHITHSD